MRKAAVMNSIVSFAGTVVGAIALGMSSLCQGGEVATYPMPKEESAYDGYQLQIDSQPVVVYACRVSAVPLNQEWPGYQRPMDQTELAGFAYWDMKGSVKVEVTAKQTVNKVVVRPRSLEIQPKVEGNKISFTLDRIMPLVVEVNGYHNALHLFPNPIQKDIPKTTSTFCTPQCNYCSPALDSIPKSSTPHLRYFGPGVHDIGTLQLQTGDLVYIAGGAVVYGSFISDDAENIRVWGRGVLDGSRIQRADKWARGGFGCIHFRSSSNIRVEGIVLRDPNSWGCTLRGCHGVNLSNLKLVGFWRYNADGIDVWNCQDVAVENCFIRSFDDAHVVKGFCSNIRFNRSVIWCDWGRAMVVSGRSIDADIDNVTFENMEVIRSTHRAMAIVERDRGSIRNIKFDNVNVEFDEWNARPKMQESRDEEYVTNLQDKYCSKLLDIYMPKPKGETRLGVIDNVLFKDIHVYGNTNACSTFSGLDAEHGVSNVMIKNLRFNGKVAEDVKQANLHIGHDVTKVQIVK
jgi:hypothetical protein